MAPKIHQEEAWRPHPARGRGPAWRAARLHPRDLRSALLGAANTPGDGDSIACITGALVGAREGIDAIPAPWLDLLERADEPRYLALDLLAIS